MEINLILSYILKTLHSILIAVALIGPYVTNNKTYLSWFLFYFIALLTMWYINGHCFITDWEKYLDGDTTNNDNNKSFITEFLESFIPFDLHNALSTIPLINSIVCLLKINGYLYADNTSAILEVCPVELKADV